MSLSFLTLSLSTKLAVLTGVCSLSFCFPSHALAFGTGDAMAAMIGSAARAPQTLVPVPAAASPQQIEAEGFIKSMTSRGIGLLSNQSLSREQRVGEFRKILRASFDVNAIAKFSLGQYWKASTEGQRQDYVRLFEKMILDVYSKRFDDYKGEAITVSGSEAKGEDIIVSSAIVPPSGPNVKVDWRVRKRANGYKVIDVIIEGVSMALTQRSDFASVIERGGGSVDVLIAHIKQ